MSFPDSWTSLDSGPFYNMAKISGYVSLKMKKKYGKYFIFYIFIYVFGFFFQLKSLYVCVLILHEFCVTNWCCSRNKWNRVDFNAYIVQESAF